MFGTGSCIGRVWKAWTVDASSHTTSSALSTWVGWTSATTTTPSWSDASVTCPWPIWAGTTNTTTAGRLTTSLVWQSWIRETEVIARPRWTIVDREAAAEARRVQEAETRRIAAAAAESRKKADRRSKALLVSTLSDEQRRMLEEHGYFDEVVPGHGTFRIHRGSAGNVRRLDAATGRESERFCIHAVDYVPDYDNMLMQRLMLQTEPDRFLRIANRTVLS